MNSFSYARDKLHQFNRFVAETPSLRDFFITKNFNYLQAFQTNLFFDFKYYYEKTRIRASHQIPELAESEQAPSSLARHLLALFVSTAALLKMFLRRPKVAVVCVDKINSKHKSDFRLEGIYDYLKNNCIAFFEIAHTVIGGHFKKFLFERKRAVFYLETLDALFKFFVRFGLADASHPKISTINFSQFQKEEEMFRHHLGKYLFLRQQRRFRIKFFKKVFKLSPIKTILTIDDPRHYHEITAGAHVNGVPVYAFQHGAFSKYTVGWLYCGYGRESIIKPDRLFVWGKYWKEELLRLGTYFTSEELVFGGNPKNLKNPRVVPEDPIPHQKTTFLIPYEIEAPKKQITDFIHKMLACPNTEVVFKVRSDASAKAQLVEYGLKEVMPKNFRIVTNLSSRDMAKIDAVVGTHSTYLYEVLDYLVPVFILKTDLDYSEGMLRNSLADEMDREGDVCRNIIETISVSRGTLLKRREKFYENFGSLQEVLRELLVKTCCEITFVTKFQDFERKN